MGLCWGSPSDNPKTPNGRCWDSPSDNHKTPNSTANNIRAETSKSSNLTSSATSREDSRFSASSGDEVYPEGQIMSTPDLRTFTLAELRAATRNFKTDTLLGEGGFGKVFKGWLEDKAPGKHHGTGTVIAVKKLNSESLQGFEEWQSEVNFLGRVSHPNLVKLLGYCLEGSDLLLVYEFMQKGSLENHLFRKGSAVQPLPWDIRLKIAIGAAKGLAFLHASQKQVIYRDFKPANILLDGSYNAKISDFGLAKLGPSTSRSHVTTRVMGTNGYVAPEYAATGHLYVKSDVYGFGVHLAELLTGLRALDTTRPKQQETLTDWIKPYLFSKKKLKTIMDPKLERNYPSRSAFRIANLALRCIEDEPKNRPSMKEVVEALENVEEEEAAADTSAVDRKARRPNQTTMHHRNRTSQVRLGHRSIPAY